MNEAIKCYGTEQKTNNTKFLADQNVPNTAAYYKKWSVQFPGGRPKKDLPTPSSN